MTSLDEPTHNFNKLIPYLNALLPTIKNQNDSVDYVKSLLKEIFMCNLEEFKQEALNRFILEKQRESERSLLQSISRDDLRKKQHLLFKKFKRQEKQLMDSNKGTNKIDKPKDKKKIKRGANHMSTTKIQLSEDLQKFLGSQESTRTEVVKLTWAYIKKHNLQNPEDKREVICDDQMRAVFGDKVTIFSMNRLLSKHIITPSSENGTEGAESNTDLNSEISLLIKSNISGVDQIPSLGDDSDEDSSDFTNYHSFEYEDTIIPDRTNIDDSSMSEGDILSKD